jgi:hypothetical protein
MKEVIKGTLPNKKDVLRPTKTPKVKIKEAVVEPIVETEEPTLVETMKVISKGGIIQDISKSSPLHILAFVLLIPAAILAIPGFFLLLLADHFKKD